jgi:hypothetical protein
MSSLPLISGLRVAQCLVFCVLEIIVCLFSCGHFIDATDDTVAIFKLVLLKRRYLIYINMYNCNFATIKIPFFTIANV